MDGTLLDDNKKISEKNIEAITRLKNSGVYFVIATGRHDSMIKSYLDQLKLEMPVISCNGAMVRNPFSDKMFASEPIDTQTVIKVADICKETGADYHIYCKETIYGETLTNKIFYYSELSKTLPATEEIKTVIDLDYKKFINSTDEELYKILAVSDNKEILNKVQKRIVSETGLTVAQSDKNLLDIMGNGISKASALKTLIAKLGIKVEETAAIGDQVNDLEMIKFAGCGIAVANAVDSVKKEASFVTKNNNCENAVAEAIEKLIN